MRKRVEDLGRISVLMDNLIELDIWYLYTGRDKDFVDYFDGLEETKKEELLHKLIYGLRELKDGLYDVSSIAEGNDRLNEPA